MLELLANLDPFAAILGGLWLFAAGLFPVGFMLGSTCSACCQQSPCTLCTEGSLPETLTVTFSGLPDTTPGPSLASLTFSSCYGAGAAGKVTAPFGDPATSKGPITAVAVTNGGSGYAVLGRVAPTLTISGSGTGATFTPTLSNSKDNCKLDFWSLASVAATGGTGYTDGESLTITAASGDTQVAAASATLFIGKSEPTITLGGTATTTVAISLNGAGYWTIASVAVTDGGTGYTEGQALTFSAGVGDVTVTSATATARVVHDEPQNAILNINSAGGSGAVLEPVWQLLPSNQWPAPHKKTYRLASVTVINGGTDYADYEQVYISFPTTADGDDQEGAYIDVDIVGTGGVIQQVHVASQDDPNTPSPAGRYVGSQTDALHSVNVSSTGEYYQPDPDARRVAVQSSGTYYRQDASVPPYVAAVTVGVSQTSPSAGSGASLSAVIDSNTASPTFGQITGVTINSGGDGYLAYTFLHSLCCGLYYNGMSVVVKRNNSSLGVAQLNEPCVYTHRMCGVGNMKQYLGYVQVSYLGPNTPPQIGLASEYRLGRDGTLSSDESLFSRTCDSLFSSTSLVSDCSTWSVDGSPIQFVADNGATATVTAGGEYDESFRNVECHICCRGDSAPPAEYEVTLTDNQTYPGSVSGLNYSGTYVIATQGLTEQVHQFFSLPPAQYAGSPFFPRVQIRIGLAPCALQYTDKWLDAPEFAPGLDWTCPYCWQNCRVIGGVTLTGSTSLNPDLPLGGSALFATAQQQGCNKCVSTPLCTLAGVTATGGSVFNTGTFTVVVAES